MIRATRGRYARILPPLSRICYAHGTDVPGRKWVVNLQLGVTVLEQSIGVVHKFDVSYKF